MRSAMTLFVMFLLSLDAGSYAQSFDSTLHGLIRMSAQPGVTAVVRVRLERTGITVRDVFLRDNRFELRDLPGGRYTLIVDAPGFESSRQEVNVPADWVTVELRRQPDPIGSAEVIPFANLKIPKSARLQFDAGKRKLTEDKCPDAIVHLGKALQSYPEYGDAHRTLGECYARMNRLDAAEQEFKLALEQPHQPEVHLLLADVYKRSEKNGPRERQLDLFAAERASQRAR
jgi:tetratricopeptide (TPR) repeat protein